MAAAGVVTFFCGAGSALAQTDYVNNGHTLNHSGGAITADGTGGAGVFGIDGLTVTGNFINNGTAEAKGGRAYSQQGNLLATGGTGINVDGDILNYGLLKVEGGEGATERTPQVDAADKSYGGAGLKSTTGTLYNYGRIETLGGLGSEHDGFGGAAISVNQLVNSGNIDTVGGRGHLSSGGNIIGPKGGAGILISNGLINNANGVITGTGGVVGNASGSCNTPTHQPYPGAGLEANGVSENYGKLIGNGGSFWDDAGNEFKHPQIGGHGMFFSTTAHMDNWGYISATGATIITPSNAANKVTGGDGIQFAGGLTNHIKSTIVAQGGSANAGGLGEAQGGMGIKVSNGAYNYGSIYTKGGLKINNAIKEIAGEGINFNNGLTNYKDSFLTMFGHGGAATSDGGAAVTLGGTPKGLADDLPHGAWFKEGAFLVLATADVATGVNSGAYINANGLSVVFENSDYTKGTNLVLSTAASAMGIGGKVTHTNFIVNTSSSASTTAGGVVNPGEIGIGSYTGPVMDVTISSTGGGGSYNYTFEAERVGWSSQLTDGNASVILSTLERDLAGKTLDASNSEWANILASVDFQADVTSLRNRAHSIWGDTMPVATTQAMQSMGRSARFVSQMFSRNLQSVAKCRQLDVCNYANNYGRDTNGLVCSNPDEPYMIWAQPFYYDGRQKGKQDWFYNFDETYYGITTGIAYDVDFAILSAEMHYYQGDLKTKKYKADVDALGFELGIGRCFNINDNINPWVEIRAGYTWMQVDQKRTDMNGAKASSKPDAGVWTGGITVNNAFSVGEQVRITPHIGVDVMHMQMDSYTEKNSALATKVEPDDYTSVQGTIGIAMDYTPTENVYFEARAAYHHEFADRSADVTARGVGLSSNLKVDGDDLSRSSATLGAGVGVRLTDNVSVRADYDVRLADKYVGHQVSATVTFTF